MMDRVFAEIAAERARQDAKWGIQDHPDDRPGSWWNGQSNVAAMDRRCGEFGIPTETLAKSACDHQFAWGQGAWPDILVEEVSEAIAAAHDVAALRIELVQVAAVAVQWIEAIDRRGGA